LLTAVVRETETVGSELSLFIEVVVVVVDVEVVGGTLISGRIKSSSLSSMAGMNSSILLGGDDEAELLVVVK
jgi:hypothetical protein